MGFGLALILLALVCVTLWLYPAFQFLRGYEQKLKSTSAAIRRDEVRLGAVQLHVYKPSNNAGSVLVLIPGLHPNGIQDPRFTAFADSCAEAGFLVVTPDIQEFRNFKITNESVAILRSVIDSLPKLVPEDQRSNVGVLGISYGAGPAFLLAAERKMDYVVSVGGYYNLLHALEYSFTGAHPGNEKRKAHEWGRLIFAYQHVKELATGADAELLHTILALRLNLKESEAMKLEAQLSPDTKELLHGIVQGLSRQQQDRFRELLEQRKEAALELSPQNVLSRIPASTRIYLIHGTTDDAIPYEETLEFKEALEKAGRNPRCLLTPALEHVDMKSVSGLWDSVRLLHWQRHLLREASDG